MSCCGAHTATQGQVVTLVRSCTERTVPRARSKSVTPDVLLDQVGHGGHAGAIAVLWRGRHHLELDAQRVAWASHAIATWSAGIGKKYDLHSMVAR